MLLTLAVIIVLLRSTKLVNSVPCDIQTPNRRTCSHFYGLKPGPFNYTHVFHFCEQHGGMLAMPDTKEKFEQLQTVLKYMQKENDVVLLGARAWDEAFTFRWNKGSLLSISFRNWGAREPNVIGPGKCVFTKSGHWLVFNCDVTTSLVFAVCEFCLHDGTCSEVCICPGGDETPRCSQPWGCHPMCLPARRAASCDLFPCPLKRWGGKCQYQCNCLDSTCDPYTGKCPGPCEQGWKGERCDKRNDCPRGKYGPGCKNSCFCREHQYCDERGNCPLGCLPGVGGPDCSASPCKPGTYGTGCNLTCRCSTPGVRCAGIGGECLEHPGCERGRSGPGCDETRCPRGTWGPTCEQFCLCRHRTSCGLDTGECPSSLCMVGWQGMTCNSTKCPVGRWGKHCNLTCVDCAGYPCDVNNGLCITNLTEQGTDLCPTRCPTGTFCKEYLQCEENPQDLNSTNSTGIRTGLVKQQQNDDGDDGRGDGAIEIVWICVFVGIVFASVGYAVYQAVDHHRKKKRTTQDNGSDDVEFIEVTGKSKSSDDEENKKETAGEDGTNIPTDGSGSSDESTGNSVSEISNEEPGEDNWPTARESTADTLIAKQPGEKNKQNGKKLASKSPTKEPDKKPSEQNQEKDKQFPEKSPAKEQDKIPEQRKRRKSQEPDAVSPGDLQDGDPEGETHQGDLAYAGEEAVDSQKEPWTPMSPAEDQTTTSYSDLSSRLRDKTLSVWKHEGEEYYDPRSPSITEELS